MIRQIFSNIKAISIAFGAIIVAVFGFIFVRRGNKIEELEQEVEHQKREKEVVKKVAKQEVKQEKFKSEVAKKNEKDTIANEKQYNETAKKTISKPDGEEYEVEL